MLKREIVYHQTIVNRDSMHLTHAMMKTKETEIQDRHVFLYFQLFYCTSKMASALQDVFRMKLK